ncbi:MAG: DUF3332 family protein [bacterium]
MKKLVNLAVAGSLCMAVAGCYGPFELTKKLHRWNGDVGDKWGNEAVFLVFSILPVYGFTVLADALVLNSIEFWGGKNPATAKQIRSVENGDSQAVMTWLPETRRLRVDMFRKGKAEGGFVIEPGADGNPTAIDKSGKVFSAGTNPDGTVTVSDASGGIVGTCDPAAMSGYFN